MEQSFVIVSFCQAILTLWSENAKHGLFYTISGSARIKRTEKLLVKLSISRIENYAVDCVLGGKHYVYKQEPIREREHTTLNILKLINVGAHEL